jgi:hypothetical protein
MNRSVLGEAAKRRAEYGSTEARADRVGGGPVWEVV